MNVFYLITIILLIFLYSKLGTQYNLNILFAIVVVMLFSIFENNLKYIENFITYPNFKKDYIPNQNLNTVRFKLYNVEKKNKDLDELMYQNVKISYDNTFNINGLKNVLYISGNTFNQNSRFLSRYLIKTPISESNWIKPQEIQKNYTGEAIDLLEYKNDKYFNTCLKHNDILFYAGGYDLKNNIYSDKVDIYNLSWDIWYNFTLPSKEPRAMISGYLHNNVLYFAGGFKGGDFNKCYSSKIDIYDASKGHYSDKNAWRVESLPSKPRCNIKIGHVKSKILFCSGINKTAFDKIDIYDTNLKGYKWTTINMPKSIIDLNLNVLTTNDKIIFSKSINYNYDIYLDYDSKSYFNNGQILTGDNKLELIDFPINSKKYKGLYGIAYKYGDWIDEFYKKSLMMNIKNITIDMWCHPGNIDNGFYWIIGKLNYYKTTLGIICKNKKIYPIINIDGQIYQFTKGIRLIENQWNHILVSHNDNEGLLFVNYIKLKYDIKFKINTNIVKTNVDLNNYNLIPKKEINDFWIDGYVSYINILDGLFFDYKAHQSYIKNLKRFSNNINIKSNNETNLEEIEYYEMRYLTPQVYIFSGKNISHYDKFVSFTRRLIHNLSSAFVYDRYAVFYGNRIIKNKNNVDIEPILYIHDVKEQLWYEKKLDSIITSKINYSIDNLLIMCGLDDIRGSVKPSINILKFPTNVVKTKKKVEKPKINCKPGQKKVDDKCIDCDVDHYSTKTNSLICNKCPKFTYTNKKTGQSECIYDDEIFDEPKQINVRNNTQAEIQSSLNNFEKQNIANKQIDLHIKTKLSQINKIIQDYKKNVFNQI